MKMLSNFFLGKRFLAVFLPVLACLLAGFFLLNYFLPAKSAASMEVNSGSGVTATLFCSTNRLIHSIINYGGKIYVGTHSPGYDAKLYDCTSGGQAVVVSAFPVSRAESIFDMEDYNGALYISLEHGNYSGGRGHAMLYKYSGGNFNKVYENSSWNLMLNLVQNNGSLYSSLGSDWSKSELVKCTGDSCSVIKSTDGLIFAMGKHNNEVYVAKGWGSGPGQHKSILAKINGNNIQDLSTNSSTGWGYQALTSYKGSLYYTLGNKIYKYPNTQVATLDYPLTLWMGVSGDYIYAGASQDWDAPSGSSALYRSGTGEPGSWEKVANFSDMVHIFRGYVDSDGTLYIAGGKYGTSGNGKVYKVTAGSSPSVPTISSFTASPSTITSGQTATLAWSVANATSLSISGLGTVVGTSRDVTPTVTTTYTLTATNASGSATKNVTVLVNGAGNKNFSYITNGKIKLGVITDWGAGVGYLSRVDSERNLINSADKGRETQQSYYGTPNGLTWNNSAWRWNPVQAGDTYGNSSKVQVFTNDGTSIYAKTIPKDWAANNVDIQGYMEEWITLNDDTARIRYKFTYTGNSTQDSYDQELPAHFVDYDLPNLVSYRGDSPWSNGSLTSVVPGNLSAGGTNFTLTEQWTAYVDNNNWGIGMYTPGSVNRRTSYRHYNGGTSGPNGDSTSYVAPIETWSFSPTTGTNKGPVYEYDVYLTIGTLNDIRSRFYVLHGSAVPTISSFTASPATIASGQTATLTWSVANATGISISGLGAVTGASRQVSPTVTTTYTLTATNASGSATKDVTVTVGTPPAPGSFKVFTHNATKAYFSVYADGNTIYTGTYADNIGSASTYYSHFTTFNTNHEQTSSCSALNVESLFRVRKFKGSIYATVEHSNYYGNEGGPRDKGGIWKFDNGSWQFKHAIDNHTLCLDMVTTASNIYAACARTFVTGDGNNFQNIVMPNGSSAIRLAELNGKVYIAGNTQNCDWGCGSGVMYIYENGNFTAKTPPHDLPDWGLHGITAFKGKIYVATVSNENYAYIYRYDPDNGSFTEVKRVEGKGITHWMGTDGNYVYAAVAKDFDSADLYRSADGTNWSVAANLPGGLAIDGTVDANGYMYIAGGKFQNKDGYIWWNGPTTGGTSGCSVGGGGCGASCNSDCKKDPEAWYLKRYPDVKAAGVGAKEHYCAHGKNEGRENCFAKDVCGKIPPATCQEDPEAWYFYRWPDVKASAYGQMSGGALKHFCEYGKNEGPRENCFGRDACASAPPATCQEDPEAWYLNRHLDVKNDGYGQLVGGGLKHFCEHGRDEGPRANCFPANACGSAPAPTCTKAGPDDWRVTANSGAKTVYVYGVANASGVSFAVWTTANGQDDLIWHKGIDTGGGTWQADIDLAKHTGIGDIAVHVYLQHGSIWCDTANGSRISSGLISGGSYTDQQTVKVYYSTGPGITGQWWCDNHFGKNLGGTWECISVSGGSCSEDAQLNSEVACGRMAATTSGNICQANPEAWYLNRWPDVKASAYGQMSGGGLKHFCEHGKNEGPRENCFTSNACGSAPAPTPTPTPPTCQDDPEAWYLDRWADVKVSGYGQMSGGGLKHFCAYGKGENRENCFASNACGTTITTCTSWTYSSWSTCANGQQTRTTTSSSPTGCTGGSPVLTQTCTVTTACADNPETWYLNRWPDVKASAYGQMSGGGLKHFCEHGKNEGPRENCFASNACGITSPTSPPDNTCQANPEAWYLNRWPDVKNSGYGQVSGGGLKHFCAHGKNEGPRENCFASNACGTAPAPAPKPAPAPSCQSDPNGWYLNRYPDVKNNGGFYGLDHWCKYGRNEGRESCFSVSQC